MSEFEEKLRKIVNEGELWVNEPMSAHTTFRIGGPADFLVTPGTAASLRRFWRCAGKRTSRFSF